MQPVIIGTCGHPAKTKRRCCDKCKHQRDLEKSRRYYDNHRRVNWMSRIEQENVNGNAN